MIDTGLQNLRDSRNGFPRDGYRHLFWRPYKTRNCCTGFRSFQRVLKWPSVMNIGQPLSFSPLSFIFYLHLISLLIHSFISSHLRSVVSPFTCPDGTLRSSSLLCLLFHLRLCALPSALPDPLFVSLLFSPTHFYCYARYDYLSFALPRAAFLLPSLLRLIMAFDSVRLGALL